MINEELHSYLLEDFHRGKFTWMRTELELRFGKDAVADAINQGHVVYANSGEVYLSLRVPGTIQYELCKLLSDDFFTNGASILLQVLSRQDRLVDTLQFMESFE